MSWKAQGLGDIVWPIEHAFTTISPEPCESITTRQQDSAADYGIVATSAGNNIDAGQPDIHRLPSYFHLSEQYGLVAAAAAVAPAVDLPPGATTPLICPNLTHQVSTDQVTCS